jgi:hypothetical protein
MNRKLAKVQSDEIGTYTDAEVQLISLSGAFRGRIISTKDYFMFESMCKTHKDKYLEDLNPCKGYSTAEEPFLYAQHVDQKA